MALTTTDSMSGKRSKPPVCDGCRKRVQRVTNNEMNQRLCDDCAPSKLVIGYPVTE